jgi:hypothetical protein
MAGPALDDLHVFAETGGPMVAMPGGLIAWVERDSSERDQVDSIERSKRLAGSFDRSPSQIEHRRAR